MSGPGRASTVSPPTADALSQSRSGGLEGSARRPRACDSCFRRKIKCDAALPSCNWCQHHNIPCTFTREPQPRKPRAPRRSKTELDVRDLEARVNFIEKLWSSNLPTTPTAASTTAKLRRLATPTSSVGSFGKFHFAGLRLGNINSSNGIPLFSTDGQQWIQDLTGDGFPFERISSFGMPWESQQYDRAIKISAQDLFSIKLPDRKEAEESAASIVNSVAARRYPLFDDATTPTEIIERAYNQNSAEYTIEDISAQACVFAFIAFDRALNLSQRISVGTDTDYCLSKAHQLLQGMMYAPPTINGLRTALILVLSELRSGYVSSGDLLVSIAARFVISLGGHINPPQRDAASPATPQQGNVQNGLRNLFWMCYCIDKQSSFRSGRPPSLIDEYCDLTPPEIDPAEAENIGLRAFIMNIRLNLIKSKAYNMLYSVSSQKKSDTEILRSIRELDDELEQWRLTLPPPVRPPMSFSPLTYQSSGVKMDRGSLFHYLDYYHCVAIFHQAASRCKAWTDGNSGEIEAVSSSLALSVEASRSSILCLLAVGYLFVPDDGFWIVVFFPMSALLTLFCNVLLNPSSPGAVGDLDILVQAETVLQSRTSGINEQTPPSREMQHLRMTHEFVSELVKLARSAITRAQSGQESEMDWMMN